ncbi:MAG: O-antigen ligase family protein [Brevinematales bacterium]|nr:O-antigen ligase family protein [Brevinematales bacterium]
MEKVPVFLIPISIFLLMVSQLLFIPIVVFIYLFLISIKSFRNNFSIEDIFFITFILASLFSVLFAKNKTSALGGCLILLIYYMIFSVGKNLWFDNKVVFLSSFVGVVVLSVSSLIFYLLPNLSFNIKVGNLNLIEVPSASNFSYDSIVRSPSITPNPVIFSSSVLYMLPVIIVGTFSLYDNQSTLKKVILLIVAIILFGISSFTSNSRSIIVLGPMSVFLSLILMKKYREIGISVLVFFIAIGLILGFSGSFDRIKSIFDDTDHSSFLNRIDAYKMGFEIFLRNWYFGVGLINFKEYVPYYYGSYIHNLYLSVLVETGIVGIIPFLALLIVALTKSFKNLKHSSNQFIVGYLVSILVFLAHGLIDNTLYVVALGSIFWLFLGTSISRNMSKASNP